MKLVYIAGPYRAATAWDVEKNVRAAEELAHEVWCAGFAAVCPHSMCRWMSEIDEEVYMSGLLELVKKCDAVLTVGRWEKSKGTSKEINIASWCNIPVFHRLRDLELQLKL